MIPKLDILRRITKAGLVAVVRAESGEQAHRVADAVLAGGSLTGGAKTGDFNSITTTARAFIEKIREARA
jgi:hypothetical protein